MRVWISHIPCNSSVRWATIMLWHEWLSTIMLRWLHVCIRALWCLMLVRMWVHHLLTMSKLTLFVNYRIIELWGVMTSVKRSPLS